MSLAVNKTRDLCAFLSTAPTDVTESAEGSYWNYRCSAITAGPTGKDTVFALVILTLHAVVGN